MSQHGCPERVSNRSKGFPEESSSQPTMEVLVETLTGTAFEMTVSPSDTIFAIKSKIFRVEGIPISQQHLLYNLKELEDGASLRELGIAEGARLRLVLGMRGGPISTRRLPPPAPDHTEPWPDIERLLDSTRDEGEWSGSGCKVTVLVFRDGERVNMLRVRENHDGTYSPLDHNKCFTESSAQPQLPEGGAGSPENAVTQGKMMEIRRRMETLSLQRQTDTSRPGEKADIQKTRSEETLSVPSLLSDSEPFPRYSTYEAEDTFTPLCDGSYTRYEYDCAFTDRFTLPPLISPIGTRAKQPDDDLKLSDTLAGSILVKREDGAILEECIDSEECRLRQDAAQLPDRTLAPIPTADYGPLVGGGVAWRAVSLGAGGSSPAPAPPLAPPRAPRAPRAPHSHSASSLQLRAPPPAPRHPPLSDALFSSSTSELEKLKRNSSRILPALSRHRNREHLHLSDEHLHRVPPAPPAPPPVPPRPALDVAELEPRLFRAQDRLRFEEYSDSAAEERVRFERAEKHPTPTPAPAPAPPPPPHNVKKIRIRCGFCKKRLSIATVHKCRCGAEFCAPHRYAEVHGCAYDYKANAHQYLQRANPLVSAPKLPKI